MALKPSDYFDPSRVNAPSTEYPQGSAKPATPGSNDGTPIIRASVFNDIWGFLQKLLDIAGITPDGDPDTVLDSQYYDALTSNEVKKALGGIDAGDVGFDRTVRNTGKGISYGRNATGIFGVPNVRTDQIPFWTWDAPPVFSEVSPLSGVWHGTCNSSNVLRIPNPSTIINASITCTETVGPNTQRLVIPCFISHSKSSDGADNIIHSIFSLGGPNPSSTSNHTLVITYEANW